MQFIPIALAIRIRCCQYSAGMRAGCISPLRIWKGLPSSRKHSPFWLIENIGPFLTVRPGMPTSKDPVSLLVGSLPVSRADLASGRAVNAEDTLVSIDCISQDATKQNAQQNTQQNPNLISAAHEQGGVPVFRFCRSPGRLMSPPQAAYSQVL